MDGVFQSCSGLGGMQAMFANFQIESGADAAESEPDLQGVFAIDEATPDLPRLGSSLTPQAEVFPTPGITNYLKAIEPLSPQEIQELPPARQLHLACHGGYRAEDDLIAVPEGTELVFYCAPDSVFCTDILDAIFEDVNAGMQEKFYQEVVPSGAETPDLYLSEIESNSPIDLTSEAIAFIHERARLGDVLQPNMGKVHLLTCRVNIPTWTTDKSLTIFTVKGEMPFRDWEARNDFVFDLEL